MIGVLKGMNLKYPTVSGAEKAALAQARKQLEAE
jgi:hypothetical protein